MIESTKGKPGYEQSRITIYVKGRGVVLEESSMFLVNRDSGKILAIGNEAEEAIGKDMDIPPVTAVNPLRRGVIASYTMAEKMFNFYLKKALEVDCSIVKRLIGTYVKKPRVVVCVPEEVTEVEEKAFLDAFYQAGAKEVTLTDLPLESAVTCLEKPYSVFVGITWSGKEKERLCIKENCPHRIL